MDPCPFIRLTVTNLALKIPLATKPTRSAIHPSSSPCFCKIKLKHHPPQTSIIPHIPPSTATIATPTPIAVTDSNYTPATVTFHLSKSDLQKLAGKSLFTKPKASLKIKIYAGRRGTSCGVSAGRLVGKVSVPLDLAGADSKAVVFHNGWVSFGRGDGKNETASSSLFLCVKAEPDPRFVFQFDGEPECSPQVFQIQGNIRQPVFTCKFSFRSSADRNHRSRSLPMEPSCSRNWLASFGSERERPGKERKGWSVTVHDLSGSPVALASMVTPFVASPGSDRVSRSNPGCWLILRPGDGTWKPWGRLEAWRERGTSDGLGYRFEVIPDSAGTGVVVAESTLSAKNGGKFEIDMGGSSLGNQNSPGCSPRGSGDYGYSLWPFCMYRGFVMAAGVEGEGKCSKPTVQVGVQHVNCTEDAAAHVALAAAVDLSMDACRLFSQRLRKELCPDQDLL